MANTLDAHLEAAWKLLESGDFAGARKQAEDAVALDDDSADAHTIFGAVAAAEGDVERALALLDRAMDLDPEAFDPALLAAETMAGAGQLEDALEACDVALDRAEEEDEYLDALLLRAELELGTGHPEAAQQTLGELPPAGTELPEPTHHLRVAGCLLELGELESAEQHLEAALKREPDSADALHLLGLVSEALGDREKMIARFQRVRALDVKQPEPAWSISMERLEARAQAALEELPEKARELLGNVPIVIEDYPSEELVADGLDPRLLGLFSGIPYPEQSALSGQPPHLECVMLFKRNIERDARTAEEVDQELRTTLLHETGHFFGLDEEDLEDLGLD